MTVFQGENGDSYVDQSYPEWYESAIGPYIDLAKAKSAPRPPKQDFPPFNSWATNSVSRETQELHSFWWVHQLVRGSKIPYPPVLPKKIGEHSDGQVPPCDKRVPPKALKPLVQDVSSLYVVYMPVSSRSGVSGPVFRPEGGGNYDPRRLADRAQLPTVIEVQPETR
jgi:hypothetical protein